MGMNVKKALLARWRVGVSLIVGIGFAAFWAHDAVRCGMRDTDTQRDIEKIERLIARFAKGIDAQPRREVERRISLLEDPIYGARDYHNQKIAKAKLLAQMTDKEAAQRLFEQEFLIYPDKDPPKIEVCGSRPWEIRDPWTIARDALREGALTFCLASAWTWFALLVGQGVLWILVPFLWYWFLARCSEVSRAIRGQPPRRGDKHA